jgi:diguanylate cyclase (GGDEF)-like protein
VFDPARHPIDAEAPAPDSGLPSGRRRRWKLPPHDDPRAESTIRVFASGGRLESENTDDEETRVTSTTGLADRRAWNEAFRREQQRLARYGCLVTVMVAEIDGLDSLAAVIGLGAADRLIAPIEAMMRRNTRAADVPARTGRWRLVALLPETDEIDAINYVERVRSECDMWLEAKGLAVRLAIGWAQPTVGGSLAEALRLADDRMNADRRRKGLGTPSATCEASASWPARTPK